MIRDIESALLETSWQIFFRKNYLFLTATINNILKIVIFRFTTLPSLSIKI